MALALAIDQGTTNTKAIVVDEAGRVHAHGSAPLPLRTARHGWAEQDADECWASVLTAVRECLDGGLAVDAVAISTQRESVVAWSRSTGDPLGPIIGWQDVRTAAWCAEATGPDADALVRERTGLRIDPMFSAPKIRWLLDHVDAPRGDVCVGTIDAWLVWRLTGGTRHVCEAGNAGRTLLYDVVDLAWSPDLLAAFDIPAHVLPRVQPSTGPFGTTQGLPDVVDGTPIVAVLADSHAALYAHGCREPGSAKATYGTGSSVMAPTDTFHPGSAAVGSTLAWLTDGPQYAREGNIVSSGAALVWMARTLGLPDVTALLALADEVPDSGGVVVVPALAGLGAPHWVRHATATMSGLTQATTPAHLARAALDAVAHQICDIVDVIDADGAPVQVLSADGGASASTTLMQIQADLLGRPVRVATTAELSALGAGLLAHAALGASPPHHSIAGRTVQPQSSPTTRAARRAEWATAVRRTIQAAGDDNRAGPSRRLP